MGIHRGKVPEMELPGRRKRGNLKARRRLYGS